jgi:hypothetical protein
MLGGLNSGRVGVFDFLALRHRTLSPSESPTFFTSTQELAVARLLTTQDERPKDIGARQAGDRLCGRSSAQLWPLQVHLRATDARSCTSTNTVSMTPTLGLGYHD